MAGQNPHGNGPGGQLLNSSQVAPAEQGNNVRPIREKQVKTCIEVVYEGETIIALVDTGSDVTIAGDDVARRFGWRIQEHATKTVKIANDEEMIIYGIVKIPLHVGGRRVKSEILITPDLSGLIIGVDWLKKQGEFIWNFRVGKIKFEAGDWLELQEEEDSRQIRRVYISKDTLIPASGQAEVDVRVKHKTPGDKPYLGYVENSEIPSLNNVFSARSLIPAQFSDIKISILNTEKRSQVIPKGTEIGILQEAELVEEVEEFSKKIARISEENISLEENEVINKMMADLPDELTDEQRDKVKNVLIQNRKILSTGEYDIGRTHLVEHRIDTGEHRPIRQPLRRHAFQHLTYIKDEVTRMEAHGIIEPAASPWASNVVLVRKKDGTLRFCIDYRKLNSVTYKDSYPLPLIDNCLNALAGSSWFSTLDLRSGYHNIPIAEEDRDKTAFVTPGGCFRFTVMPFGLTCAPSVFQRLMDVVLCGLSYLTCLVYLDDIIVFGRSFEEQLTRLNEVFERLEKANLKLKPSKCSLCQRSVQFLGHVVSKEGITMQEEKIAAIRDWPPCQTVSEVRAFMGLSGYYRRFVKDFSSLASPLYSLMKKDVDFVWTDDCQQAFVELKKRLMNEPILALPQNDKTYILDTDASDYGLGAVLSQQQDEGEKVIAYASKTLSRAEQKYETTRKELLAIVYGLRQHKQYLLGRHFIIRTDHAALTWLRKTAEPMPQLARWLAFIEQFDYEVVHRPGLRHGNADGLSRRPHVDEDAEEVRVLRKKPSSGFVLAEESLPLAQQKDPELQGIVGFRLRSNTPPVNDELQTESELTKRLVTKWDRLLVINGLIYLRDKPVKPGEPTSLRLLLPRSKVEEALRLCHAGTTGGHFCSRKTHDQVRRRFFWDNWKGDTERFCRQCDECVKYHRGKLAKQGPLRPVIPGTPYERWYIDLTGPHPRSDRGNIYILTCMDSFTKWTEAFAIRNKEAETIARVLVEQLFNRFGTPLSILSDQGKEVDGRIMNEICNLFGITKLHTTPYKPSTNQVERFHRTMNSILAKTVSDHHRDWDSHLSFALAAFRATRHDSTGYTPNFLVLGREVRAPPDLVYGHPNDEPDENYDAYVEKVRENSVAAFSEVRQSLQRSAQRSKRYYDIGVKPKRFEIGQWVLYFNPRKFRGKQNKWVRQFEGPYLVVATPTSLTAKIQRSAKTKLKTVHIDKLKAYAGNPPKSWILPISSVDSNDELEIIEGVDDTPEVCEPSAKVTSSEHLAGQTIFANEQSNQDVLVEPGWATTSSLAQPGWGATCFNDRILGVDESGAKVAQSQHRTNLPTLLSDFDQHRAYPTDANDQNELAETRWTAKNFVKVENEPASSDNFVKVDNLGDFGPNLISCVENGPASPEFRPVIDNKAEEVDEPSKQSLVGEEAQRGNEFLYREARHKRNVGDFAQQTVDLSKEITEADARDGLAIPTLTPSQTQRGQNLLLCGCEVQRKDFDTSFDTQNPYPEPCQKPRSQLLEKCDTSFSPAPSAEPSAKAFKKRHLAESHNNLNQRQMKLADSFLAFNDKKHTSQLSVQSDMDLGVAQCGSRLNLANAKLILDSNVEREDESEQICTPDLTIDDEKLTEDTKLKTAVNSLSPDYKPAFSNFQNGSKSQQYLMRKLVITENGKFPETEFETVSKSSDILAKPSLRDSDGNLLAEAGMLPRSIRDRRRPAKFENFETQFFREKRSPENSQNNYGKSNYNKFTENKDSFAKELRIKQKSQLPFSDTQYPYKPIPNPSLRTCFNCGKIGHVAKGCHMQAIYGKNNYHKNNKKIGYNSKKNNRYNASFEFGKNRCSDARQSAVHRIANKSDAASASQQTYKRYKRQSANLAWKASDDRESPTYGRKLFLR